MKNKAFTQPGQKILRLGFEEVEHTADRALRIYGCDLEQLLRHAAWGMNSLMIEDPDAIPSTIRKNVELNAPDRESLLVEWLSELAYWAETQLLLFKIFDFRHLTQTRLQAVLTGGPVRQLQGHIKAVTYHDLKILQSPAGLAATVVFDV